MTLEEILAALKTLEEGDRKKVLESLGSNEINQILSKIRSEEKNKLQKDLEKRENKIKELERSLEEVKTVPANQSDIEKVLEQSKNREKELAAQIQELATTFTSALKEQELKTAKAEVLGNYKGEIIPELISGSTPSEIAQSAQAAHLKYLEMQSRFENQFKEKYKVSESAGQPPTEQQNTASTPELTPQTTQQSTLASVLSPEQLKVLQDATNLLQTVQTTEQKPALGVPNPTVPQQPSQDSVQNALQSMQQAALANSKPSMIDLQSSMRQGYMPSQQVQQNAAQVAAPSVNPAMQDSTVNQSGNINAILQQAGDLSKFAANRTSIMQAAKSLLNNNK